MEAEPAAFIEQRPRLGLGLHPVHRHLHVVREVLHAEGEPVESEAREQRELVERRHARVDLDGDFRARLDVEVAFDRGLQRRNLVEREIGRGAAAPVVLDDLPPTRERLGEHGDLAVQVLEIVRRDVSLLGDDDRAAAERAALLAEWQMQIERQRFVARRGTSQLRAIGGLVEAFENSTAVGYDV